MNKNFLVENSSEFPSEIERFYIPERSLEKLIGAKIGGPANLIEKGQDEIQISIPYNFFEKTLEEKYNDEIKSVKINGGKATVNLSEKKNKKKKKPKKETNESNFKNIFGLL